MGFEPTNHLIIYIWIELSHTAQNVASKQATPLAGLDCDFHTTSSVAWNNASKIKSPMQIKRQTIVTKLKASLSLIYTITSYGFDFWVPWNFSSICVKYFTPMWLQEPNQGIKTIYAPIIFYSKYSNKK